MKQLVAAVHRTARIFLAPITAINLLFALTLCYLPLQAQTISNNINLWPVVVSAPNVVLDQGEEVEIAIQIGTAALPVINAVGYELTITLGEEATMGNTVHPSLSGSWLATASSNLTETSVASNRTYRVECANSGALTGQGTVLRITVTAAQDNVQASKLVKAVGGLMQIDNLDLRAASPEVTALAWPNPTHGILNISPSAHIQSMQLQALDGKVVAQFGPSESIDLSAFPKGAYILRMQCESNQLKDQKILIH